MDRIYWQLCEHSIIIWKRTANNNVYSYITIWPFILSKGEKETTHCFQVCGLTIVTTAIMLNRKGGYRMNIFWDKHTALEKKRAIWFSSISLGLQKVPKTWLFRKAFCFTLLLRIEPSWYIVKCAIWLMPWNFSH